MIPSINWVYYGWNGSTTYQTFDEAAQYGLALRSNTGEATSSGVDGETVIVEPCTTIDDTLVCGGNDLDGTCPYNTPGSCDNGSTIVCYSEFCQALVIQTNPGGGPGGVRTARCGNFYNNGQYTCSYQ